MNSSPPRLPLLLYRSLTWLLVPYLRWRFAREGRQFEDPHFAPQRRGRAYPTFAQPPLWFHAASVGEINALLPLLEAVQQAHPQLPLLLTTNTVSSGAIARSKLPEGATHCYLPFDWDGAVTRFLQQTRPRLGIIMETELWPNLYRHCGAAAVPLLIVNGRVSEKTLRAPGWLRRLYRYCLQQSAELLARSELDRERFLRLGASASRCHVVGNIKFAAIDQQGPTALDFGRDYVLAASTRDEEEQLVVESWLRSARRELLVIAPRHPQRLEEILRQLARFGLRTAIRSRGELPDTQTQLYLADTFGELRALMAGARVVFMGGSLVEKGGHNLLEPAALGKAVVTGPHMENFLDETRLLLEGEGLLQVNDEATLAEAFTRLLQDEAQRQQLGDNARATLQRQQGILLTYLEAIEGYLKG